MAMKTNALAQRLVKTRVILATLTIAAIVGLELGMGGLLAARVGQTTASQIEGPQVPNVGLADVMLTAR